MEYCSNSAEETEALGAELAVRLRPGDVVAYTGDLGAGKTAFTRGIARGLGIPEGLGNEPLLPPQRRGAGCGGGLQRQYFHGFITHFSCSFDPIFRKSVLCPVTTPARFG